MRRILDILRCAVRLLIAQERWKVERAQFENSENDRFWGAGYTELAFRAEALGWCGSGGFWNLLKWAGVRSDDCAGPKAKENTKRALESARRVIEKREAEVKLTYETKIAI